MIYVLLKKEDVNGPRAPSTRQVSIRLSRSEQFSTSTVFITVNYINRVEVRGVISCELLKS